MKILKYKIPMMAIISVFIAGNGYGQAIIPPKVYTVTPTYVNLSDGSFSLQETDFKVGSLTLSRHHLGGSKDPDDPPFGPKMTSNFDIFIDQHRTSSGGLGARYKPVVNMGDSSSGIFVQYQNPATPPMWSSDESMKGYLELIGSAYRYTAHDGTVYDFNPSVHIFSMGIQETQTQRVSKISSPDGRVEDFFYDSNQRLKLVRSNDGYAVAFDYNSTGKVSGACGYNTSTIYVDVNTGCAGAAIHSTYSYNNDGYIVSSTDPLNQITTYQYAASTAYGSQISCYTPPGYTSCKIANSYGGQPWQVTHQVLGDGSTWSFSYGGPGQIQDNVTQYDLWEEPYNTTVVTDPNGNIFYAMFNRYSPYSFTDANNNTTNYQYYGGFEAELQYVQSQNENDGNTVYPEMSEGEFLVSTTYPEGNSYKAEYHGPFISLSSQISVEKSGNTSSQHTIQYGYSDSCSSATKPAGDCPKPIWIKDSNGNQTDFSYATHGGILSEMGPAPTSGAARPLKLTTWTQRYAWVKNSSGTLVQADSPIWLKSTETQCQGVAGSNATSCDGAAPIVTVTYEYGATGTWEAMLLKGKAVTSSGVTLRTCYTYDFYGRKLSESSPNANLVSCP